MLFEVMAGYDDGDPCSAPVDSAKVNVAEVEEAAIRAANIGFFEDDGRTPVTAETRSAVQRAASLLSKSGLRVEPFRPEGLEEARQLWGDFFVTAGAMILNPMLRGHEGDLSPILQEFLSLAKTKPAHTGESLLSSWLGRDSVREQFLVQMRKYPILLCPTAAVPAFRHGDREWQIDGKKVKYLDAWSYCEWFNLLGFPAAVVPIGRAEKGLPIGVQIVGLPWQDELVLGVAARLEAERGPWQSPEL
jgi:Asp-tRNA(Asn)/Glu-tRNA(Gln) amidotransferase A subunit family amidase